MTFSSWFHRSRRWFEFQNKEYTPDREIEMSTFMETILRKEKSSLVLMNVCNFKHFCVHMKI